MVAYAWTYAKPALAPYFLAAFKIRDGGLYRVEEISTALPYLMPAP